MILLRLNVNFLNTNQKHTEALISSVQLYYLNKRNIQLQTVHSYVFIY